MPFVEFKKSIRFSSNPQNGSINLNSNGNRFTVQLNNSIAIPQSARDASIELNNGELWNNNPNISSENKNNMLDFVYGVDSYNFVVPDGLYSLNDLNAFLTREFKKASPVLPDDLFVLVGNNSTQRVLIDFNYAGIQIDFTTSNIRTILGFDSRLSPLAPSTIGEEDIADGSAQFDRVTAWQIRMSFLSNGIPVNNQSSNTLAYIPITAGVGSLQFIEPRNPVPISLENLIGNSINNFDVELVDQEGRDVDTLGEYWEFVVLIRYCVELGSNRNNGRLLTHH